MKIAKYEIQKPNTEKLLSFYSHFVYTNGEKGKYDEEEKTI